MTIKNPNKETIRRVCSMFKCNSCWLLNEESEPLSLLVKLDNKHLDQFKDEQQAWSGFIFNVYNQNSPTSIINSIKMKGEMLMPVDKDIPLKDIKKRRKPVRR